jgi:hypothetical protein
MLRVQFERTDIALDGHVDRIVVRDLWIIEFDIDPRKIIPSHRIVRRDFHEALVILLGFHELLLVGIDPPKIEEREHIVRKHLERMLELGFASSVMAFVA